MTVTHYTEQLKTLNLTQQISLSNSIIEAPLEMRNKLKLILESLPEVPNSEQINTAVFAILKVALDLQYVWNPGEVKRVIIDCPNFMAAQLAGCLNRYGFQVLFGIPGPLNLAGAVCWN